MTYNELDNRINGVIRDLEGGVFYDIMIKLSLDAIAMVKQRVTETGVNADGKTFASIRPYSPSYQAYKQSIGRYRGFVDFSLTTRMWSSVKLFSSPDQIQKGIAKITATTAEDQKKLNDNTELRGPILELSDNEKQILKENYNDMLLEIFRKRGL